MKSVTGLPADYSLFALALASSFLFLFLWTDPVIVRALGVKATYISLLAFNAFPTAFALVTIQTEPCTLLFTLAAFLAFARGHDWLAAGFAGAASAMRISGAATGAALGLAILWRTWQERRKIVGWIEPCLVGLFSSWGLLATAAYHYRRFRDPLMYVHAHGLTYAHSGSIASLFDPKTEWLLRSMDHPLHEGVVLAFSGRLVFAGTKERDGPLQESGKGLSLCTGCACDRHLDVGIDRARLVGNESLPTHRAAAIFLIGALMKQRPLLLFLWIMVSFWHYRQVDLCDYIGGVGEARLSKCNVPQWVGHW